MKPKLIINNKLPAFGRFYGDEIAKPFKNTIEINLIKANDANLIKKTIRHELIHAILDKAKTEEDVCVLIANNFDNIIAWSEEFYQICLDKLEKE